MAPRLALVASLVCAAACNTRPGPPLAHAEPPAPEVLDSKPKPGPGPAAPASACPGSPPAVAGPITLTIVDAFGHPIGGAEIRELDIHSKKPQHARVALADADGRVTVSARASVSVAAAGFLPLHGLTAADFDPPRIHLLPVSTISGRVHDAASKAPLAGVALVVVSYLQEGATASGMATTDADGRFRVTGLQPGRYYVKAEDDSRHGHRPVALGLGESLDDVDITAHRLVRVEGRVRDADHNTCTWGHVALHIGNPSAGGYGCSCSGAPDIVTSGLDPKTGVARLLVAPGHTYGVEVYCEGHLISTHKPLVVRRRDLRNLVWTAARGLTVRGRVLGDDGEPLAEAEVRATYNREDVSFKSVADASTSTDENGEFTLSGLAAGSPELFVHGDREGGWYFGQSEVELDSSDIAGLEITADFHDDDDDGDSSARCAPPSPPPPPPPPELRGVVLDASGAPVPNALVVHFTGRRPSFVLDALRPLLGHAPVLTDAHGSFTIPFEGKSRTCSKAPCDSLIAFRLGGGEGSAEVSSPDQHVELRVDRRATITGTVKTDSGRPVTRFGVTPDQNRREPTVSYQYDPAGSFELPGLLPGTYFLGVHSSAGDSAQKVTVTAGQRLHLDVVVKPHDDE